MYLTDLTNQSGVRQELNESVATAVFNLGDIYADRYGNEYRYVQAGAAITSSGLVLTLDEDELEKEDADTGAATAEYNGRIYSSLAQLTDGSGTPWELTPSAHKGWYGVVNDGTEKGQIFQVADNSATVLYLEYPLTTALSSGDNDIEVFSPYRVIMSPTGGGANVKTVPLGIANGAVTDEYYFWAQISGITGVCVAGTTNTIGVQVGLSGVADGAGICALAGTDKSADDFNPVGVILRGGDTDDAKVLVKLMLPR